MQPTRAGPCRISKRTTASVPKPAIRSAGSSLAATRPNNWTFQAIKAILEAAVRPRNRRMSESGDIAAERLATASDKSSRSGRTERTMCLAPNADQKFIWTTLNADEVDGSRSRHLSAKVGLLSCKPEQRSHPQWRLARSASGDVPWMADHVHSVRPVHHPPTRELQP